MNIDQRELCKVLVFWVILGGTSEILPHSVPLLCMSFVCFNPTLICRFMVIKYFHRCCWTPCEVNQRRTANGSCCNTINNQTYVAVLGCLHSCVNSDAAPIKSDHSSPLQKHFSSSVICVISCFNGVKVSARPQRFHFQPSSCDDVMD